MLRLCLTSLSIPRLLAKEILKCLNKHLIILIHHQYQDNPCECAQGRSVGPILDDLNQILWG